MGQDKSLSEQYERGAVPVSDIRSERERDPEPEEAKFKLGRIAVNPEAQGALNPDDVNAALQNHAAGHWGQADTLTRMEQDETIATGAEASVTSNHFDRNENEFWVTTNGDRTVTSVSLAPDFEQEPLERRRQEQRTEEPSRSEEGLPERDGRKVKTWSMLLHVEKLNSDGTTGQGRVIKSCPEFQEAEALQKTCPGLVIHRRTGPRPLQQGDVVVVHASDSPEAANRLTELQKQRGLNGHDQVPAAGAESVPEPNMRQKRRPSLGQGRG